MNDAMKHLRKLFEDSYADKEVFQNIEQTIAELEIYLAANPDDEIAQVQYRQYLSKRKDFLQVLMTDYDEDSDSEMHA
ncbi:MAG: hypothetical protein ACQEXQ_04350 [Bacillota bacterium]